MSIKDLSVQMISQAAQIEELEKTKAKMKRAMRDLGCSVIGEIGRQIVRKLFLEGKVKEYRVDGKKW